MALEAVQAQAGHASIESTRIYLHLADDWLAAQYRKAAEVIDAQVFAGQPAGQAQPPGAGGERPAAAGRRTGWARCRGWAELEAAVPQVAATMRRYLTQIGCVLRPGSVSGADLALRSFAAFLAQAAPEVTSIAQVTRRHIEDYKPWLAARPGQNKPRLTPATITHRLGTLRMFFIRIDEWGWDEAPPRVPMFTGDLPRQDHPLPKALDDASRRQAAARRAGRPAAAGPRHGGVAAAHRAAGQRVHRPARRRRGADRRRAAGCTSRSASSARTATCRCTPSSWPSSTTTAPRTSRPGHPLLLPRENGQPAGPARRHPDDQPRPAPPPGCPTSTPTSCGTPWPPRPSTAA